VVLLKPSCGKKNKEEGVTSFLLSPEEGVTSFLLSPEEGAAVLSPEEGVASKKAPKYYLCFFLLAPSSGDKTSTRPRSPKDLGEARVPWKALAAKKATAAPSCRLVRSTRRRSSSLKASLKSRRFGGPYSLDACCCHCKKSTRAR